MITFLITSSLLSLVGWLVYISVVKQRSTPHQQKVFLYLVIGSSLVLPLLNPGPVASTLDKLSPHPAVFGQALFDPIKTTDLQHFCNCTNPDYSHRVLYRTNSYYNFLLDNKVYLTLLILLAAGFVLFRFLLKLLYLGRLVSASEEEKFLLDGKQYSLLHTPRPLAVGAFHLWKPYIIWQQEMEDLTPAELQAVISHELSHIRQYNTYEKALLNILQCFWLLNPAFYYFRQELDLISECIADRRGAQSMGSRKAYAHLLLKLKKLQSVPLVQHFRKNSLKQRIQRLLDNTAHSPWGLTIVACLAVFAIQFLAAPRVSAGIDQQIRELETYETIYIEYPEEECIVYCPDCHSACWVEEE